jgi:hypothetical protein
MITDWSLTLKLGAAGKKQVAVDFSAAVVAHRIKGLYQEILA